MIAPLHEATDEDRPVATSAMLRARQLAAQMLPVSDVADSAPRMTAWRAWLIAGWSAVVAVMYLLAMFGRG